MTLSLSDQAACVLPATWASPGVLPSLQVLNLQLPCVAELPEQWSQGFKQLRDLVVSQGVTAHRDWCTQQLEWAGIPEEWLAPRAFPSLAR